MIMRSCVLPVAQGNPMAQTTPPAGRRGAVALVFIFLGSVCSFAQMPKGVYNWWSRPQIARSLNLSPPKDNRSGTQ